MLRPTIFKSGSQRYLWKRTHLGFRVKLSSSSFSTNRTDVGKDSNLPPYSTLGIRFSKLNSVIDMLGGRAALAGKTTFEVNELFLKPLTQASKLSLCEQLHADSNTGNQNDSVVAEANWLISHAWSYPFLQVMEAITTFVEREAMQGRNEAVIWFDMFSNSQHSMTDKPFEWWQGTFLSAVKKMGNVLMIVQPWSNPVVLTRAWCAMELFACETTGCRFEISMSKAEAEKFSSMLTDVGAIRSVHKMLLRVRSAKSAGSNVNDLHQIRSTVRKLLPQGLATLDFIIMQAFHKWIQKELRSRMSTEMDMSQQLDLVLSLCELFRCRGQMEDALRLAGNANRQFTAFYGAETLSCVRSAQLLGEIYLGLGRHNDAAPLFIKCQEILTRELGSDHPVTLLSVNSLAELYEAQGKYEAAEPLYRRVMEIRNRTLGPDHPSTLDSASNLAKLYKSQGKYHSAEPLLQRCVEVMTRLWGSEHESTIASMNNLADLYGLLRQYGPGETLYQRSLDVSRRILGVEHPFSLTTSHNLCELYMRQRKYDAAMVVYGEDTKLTTELFGMEHPATLACMNNQAELYKALGKYNDAERLYQQCMEISKRVWGAEHGFTLRSMYNVAGLLRSRGNYEAAEPLFLHCVAAMSKVLGPEHKDTLKSIMV
jgi:tetratricopeptide (TPR) repeat protein